MSLQSGNKNLCFGLLVYFAVMQQAIIKKFKVAIVAVVEVQEIPIEREEDGEVRRATDNPYGVSGHLVEAAHLAVPERLQVGQVADGRALVNAPDQQAGDGVIVRGVAALPYPRSPT
jgi:hypothetical protein